MFEAVHEDANGRPDGYVSYEIKGEWHGGEANRQLYVWDLQATNAQTRAALVGVRARRRPRRVDPGDQSPGRRAAPLPPGRQPQASHRLPDRLGLGASPRRGGAARRAEVFDDGQARDRDRRPRRIARARRARRRPRRRAAAPAAPVRCRISRARARPWDRVSLGGTSWTTLAAAGAVDEHSAGAIAEADAMFATAPAPTTISWF